jgi:hypothetical protein
MGDGGLNHVFIFPSGREKRFLDLIPEVAPAFILIFSGVDFMTCKLLILWCPEGDLNPHTLAGRGF